MITEMIRKFYIDQNAPAGDPAATATVTGTPKANPAATPDTPPGEGGTPPTAPKGYTVSTPQQRTDWNSFLDYAGKQGTDLTNPKNQAAALTVYKKANPNFSITADQIPNIQYEAYQIRKGNSFGNLDQKALGYLRQGLQPNFLNADLSKVSNLRYPQQAGYGTDLENYYNSKFNPSAAKPVSTATVAGTPAAAPSGTTTVDRTMKSDASVPNRLPDVFISSEDKNAPAGGIQRPDYGDPKSRANFSAAFQKKYGTEEGYGDIPLRVNERPYKGNNTSKNMAIAAGKATGIDPALIYSSYMVEGAAGLYPNASGPGVRGIGPDEQHPVQGAAFGLNNFVSRVPEMIKKGYLPADFADTFKKRIPTAEELEKNPKFPTDSADFKTFQDGVLAHAARLKLDYDEIDSHAKEAGIKLTPQARDFFALAHFNSGLGKDMMDKYAKNGWLKGDQWMKSNPDGSYPEVYKHVILRIKERNALKQENLFDQ